MAAARRTVVIGELPTGVGLPDGVLLTREDPPYGGPAAAIGAGVEMLFAASELDGRGLREQDWFVLVVACDMPGIGAAVEVLIERTRAGLSGDGMIAVDEAGRQQPLAGVYRMEPLARELTHQREAGTLPNLSVRALLAPLDLHHVPVPAGSTDDIDTWADAARHHIEHPQGGPQ